MPRPHWRAGLQRREMRPMKLPRTGRAAQGLSKNGPANPTIRGSGKSPHDFVPLTTDAAEFTLLPSRASAAVTGALAMHPDQYRNLQLLSTRAAAELLGLGESTLEKDRTTRHLAIPYLKLGRVVRYDPAALREWLATCRRRSTSDDGPSTEVADKPGNRRARRLRSSRA